MRHWLFFLLGVYQWAHAQPGGIGAWQEHLPYNKTIAVAATANAVWASTPYSLLRVDIASGETERAWRGTGLSETGVRTLAYDSVNNQLFVAYNNSNIDLITPQKITAVPGLKREAITGDKTIYHFLPQNNLCYASTGIGVVVIDAQKKEVRESWPLGVGGPVRTRMLTKTTVFFYAATDEGLKQTAANNLTPSDPRTWQTLSAGLPAGTCRAVASVNNNVFALFGDTVFAQTGNTWQRFFVPARTINSITASEGLLFVCSESGGSGRVDALTTSGNVIRRLGPSVALLSPQQAISKNGTVWVADAQAGLSRWSGNAETRIQPTSPADVVLGDLQSKVGTLWAAAGSVNDAWNYRFNASGLFKYEAGQWTIYNGFTTAALRNVFDFITVAVDEREGSAWAGSFGAGLYQIKKDNSITAFRSAPLGAAIGDPGSVRISGLALDASQNLWVSNYGAPQYFHVRKPDGVWRSFNPPFNLFENAVADIVVDDYNQKWIVAPKGGGLICYNHGNDLDNASDDRWRIFKSGRGGGGLPSTEVRCIVKDKNSFIWVGTTDGIAVIQCTEDPFAPACEAILPVARGTTFANFLFKGEDVRSIAVDGANRKWVATTNGAFLITADGDAVLQHYTTENSFLLHNDVRRIAVDGNTGTVYFATASGLCSIGGTATEGTEETPKIFVYPNPVPPTHAGPIAIRGLRAGSIVKITEPNGKLVFQTTSLGGQAVWDGRNIRGGGVASGAYLVFVSDEGGREVLAGKIIFIAR